MAFQLTSQAFDNEKEIPMKYTCEGENLSPPLRWNDLPSQTQSLALIVDDPDAPDPKNPKTTFVHWVIYDISPKSNELVEGISDLPQGVKEGVNDWGKVGFGGPCPPTGRHRYFFKLYALDTILPDLGHPNKKELEKKMEGHILDKATLLGMYEKQEQAESA